MPLTLFLKKQYNLNTKDQYRKIYLYIYLHELKMDHDRLVSTFDLPPLKMKILITQFQLLLLLHIPNPLRPTI